MVFVKKHAKPFCWVGKRAERQLLPPRPSSPQVRAHRTLSCYYIFRAEQANLAGTECEPRLARSAVASLGAWAGKTWRWSFSGVVSLSRNKPADGEERDAASSAATGRGATLGKGPGTSRADLLEGLPNSFPNIAPGRPPGSQLLRVPFTQPRGTSATLTAGRKQGRGDSQGKHAWKRRGRSPSLSVSPGLRAGLFFGERMGSFGPFCPAVTCGPFPEDGTVPPAATRDRIYFPTPTQAGQFPAQTPWQEGVCGENAGVSRNALSSRGGDAQLLGETPPLSLRIPVLERSLGWGKEAEAGGHLG